MEQASPLERTFGKEEARYITGDLAKNAPRDTFRLSGATKLVRDLSNHPARTFFRGLLEPGYMAKVILTTPNLTTLEKIPGIGIELIKLIGYGSLVGHLYSAFNH